jgi:hypothetical protein
MGKLGCELRAASLEPETPLGHSEFGLAAPSGGGMALGRSLRSEHAWGPAWGRTPSVRGAAAGGRLQRHIDIFEQLARMNAADAFGGLDEVVAGLAGLFASEDVGKDERRGELTGSHNEARAVDGPCAFDVHKGFHPSGEGCGSGFVGYELGGTKRRAKCFAADRGRAGLVFCCEVK